MLRSAQLSPRSIGSVLGVFLAGLAAVIWSGAAHASTLPPLPTLTGGGSLILRLDAKAINGDGNPNPTNGSAVTTWTDLSGNGNDATQATSANQPIYLANQTPNSSGAISFTGSSHQFFLDPATVSGATTWFIVYNTLGGPSNNTFQTPITLPGTNPLTTATSIDQVTFLNLSGYQNISVHTESTSHIDTVGINPAFDSDNHLFGFTFNGAANIGAGTGNESPANYQMSYDQANTTVNTSNIFGFGYTQPDGTIGQRGDDVTYYTGNISAILVYSGALNTTDFNAVQSYLNSEFLVAPEPTSLALLAIGGMMTLRRRRA